MGNDDGLTERQRVFVAEYLVDLNGRQAAIRAGYSARWAKEIGWQTLRRPAVAAAIAEAQAKRSTAIGGGAAAVLRELSAIGRANLLDYMRIGADGMPVFDLAGLDRTIAAALCEVIIEEIEGSGDRRELRRIRVKMHDKIGALDRLARHHGLYRERIGHENSRRGAAHAAA